MAWKPGLGLLTGEIIFKKYTYVKWNLLTVSKKGGLLTSVNHKVELLYTSHVQSEHDQGPQLSSPLSLTQTQHILSFVNFKFLQRSISVLECMSEYFEYIFLCYHGGCVSLMTLNSGVNKLVAEL